MKVIDEWMVCADCVHVIANGEYSHLDYSYKGTEREEREREINAGIENAGGHVVIGDDYDEFSWRRCDCCGSRLGGSRHSAVVLGPDDDDGHDDDGHGPLDGCDCADCERSYGPNRARIA